VSLELNGMPVMANTPIPVTMGWNLVSYLPDFTSPPEEALASIHDDLLIAYGFDEGILVYQPGQSTFNTLETMAPCFGYWLKLSADNSLIYPSNGPVPPMSGQSPFAVEAARLSPVDVTPTTSWVNLYSGNLTVDGETVQAGATISAHSASGHKVGSFTLTEDGVFGFMPVYADDAGNEGLTGLKKGERFYLAIDGREADEAILWTGNGDRIEVTSLTAKGTSDNSLPTSYSLAQNYPNPFNPMTNISFTVPVACQARIEVYNVLGKLVALPFSGSANAGENTVTWDGRNTSGEQVSSGVYLYRLVTDNYTETRKMMFLK
jgi:hypothetical protein